MSDLVLFERDFIERTYPSIVSDMSIAFAELVANSWDAGATRVNITLPQNRGQEIIIEDNGSGMTDEEFRNRWMVIAYNRVAHQGENIDFIAADNTKIRRVAYGRNGVGRHALVCFDEYYTIETWKDGILNVYEIAVSGGNSAFSIQKHYQSNKSGSGTKISVNAVKKFPDCITISKTLGYKFMFDPQFEVYVNGTKVEYHNTLYPNKRDVLTTKYGSLEIAIYNIPDGEKSTSNNGIAIWVNGRLVGKPSWTVGDYKIEDARRKFAVKHLVIIKADFLIDEIAYDWSSFRKTEKVQDANREISKYLRKYRIEYYKGKTTEVRDKAVRTNKAAISTLSIPAVYSLKQFFDTYLEQKPEIEEDELNIIISSLVNVLSNENGLSLLAKLSTMSDASLSDLDKILDQWSVSDIKIVLDEINSRIAVIDAVQKLCSNPQTDELHVLHPLISQARWLFGIEYDNPNYTFNRRLSTVMKELLDSKLKENTSINWSKRPDLVFASNRTVSATCIEEIDDNGISCVERILIIELKKGGSEISKEEISQAEGYVESIYKGNKLNSKPRIKAFVIGDSVDPYTSNHKTQEDFGEVFAYTYDQLVRTAEKRLFNLKTKLEEHYNQFNGEDYVNMILNEPEQLKMNEY